MINHWWKESQHIFKKVSQHSLALYSSVATTQLNSTLLSFCQLTADPGVEWSSVASFDFARLESDLKSASWIKVIYWDTNTVTQFLGPLRNCIIYESNTFLFKTTLWQLRQCTYSSSWLKWLGACLNPEQSRLKLLGQWLWLHLNSASSKLVLAWAEWAATLLYRVYSHHMMTCLIFFSLTTTFKDELKPNMWLTQLVDPLRFWHSSIMINHWWRESQHICMNIHQHSPEFILITWWQGFFSFLSLPPSMMNGNPTCEWHSWWIH